MRWTLQFNQKIQVVVEEGKEPGSFAVSMSFQLSYNYSEAPDFPARLCASQMGLATANSSKVPLLFRHWISKNTWGLCPLGTVITLGYCV